MTQNKITLREAAIHTTVLVIAKAALALIMYYSWRGEGFWQYVCIGICVVLVWVLLVGVYYLSSLSASCRVLRRLHDTE